MTVWTRDPFGIEPLYWSGSIVSRDLSHVLDRVPNDLDERTLFDFLAFGQNTDPSSTFYAHVHRVPAAHRLLQENGAMRVERWWSLPANTIRIDADEAVERFRELFTNAVLRCAGNDRVAIAMSGGLDSTSVAAALVRQRRENVHAFTVAYETLIPDVEPAWARRAGQFLKIPLDVQLADNYRLFERWDDPVVRGIEPVDDPMTARYLDGMRMLADRAPVALMGQGGDAVLAWPKTYFFDLLKHFRIDRIVREAGAYWITRRRRPPLLFRSQLRRALRMQRNPTLPKWLLADDALRERWKTWWGAPATHSIAGVHWANSFEALSSSWTRLPLAIRAPYFDLELVEFLLSLPPMPHLADKDIVRRAMKGWLPDDIRLRPKTPLAADPVLVLFNREPRKWIDVVLRSRAMDAFLDKREYAKVEHFDYAETLPVVLAMWLDGRG
ncbi:MAG TPA: asparagine synthase-related protein [Thermoanaerobaculia bacterium]|nr:asparagine synthase-related protein [Thermoanaerobaculia bacterium]